MDNIQKNLIISSRVKERRKRTRVLWDAAHKRLCELYGDMPDVRILNRFYSEKMIFENTDNPIIWDVIGAIRERARERGELISLSGTDGCCLCAHLLGAAENPLPLHYLCESCKSMRFADVRSLPWDMPDAPCTCGGVMRAKGFDIPYEMNIGMAKNPCPSIWLAPGFLKEAGEIVMEKTKGLYRICELTKHDYRPLEFVFLPFEAEEDYSDDIDRAGERYRGLPHLTLIPSEIYERLGALAAKTQCEISESLSFDSRIIAAFANGEVEGIPNFSSECLDMREALRLAAPGSSFELLQFLGATRGTRVWRDNIEELIRGGVCVIGELPTHRDDVFILLRDALRGAGACDVGIAHRLTELIWRGYAHTELDGESRALLEYLDLPEWFISYAEKIRYMSPKAHNVESLRVSLAFMWYKINCPEAFKTCVGLV